MITIDIEDIQRDLLGYLEQVCNGETVVITRGGEPVAEVKPAGGAAAQPRPFGLGAGEFTVPGDFDSPLPQDIIRLFEGA